MLRQQEQDRRQYRLICPCVPFYGADGDSCRARQFGANLPRFWAKEKKRVLGADICKGRL